jgi:CheY-like chemotaxis protein
MPDMSGLSVATRIVELEKLTMQEITPIVALTADARPEIKSQCLAAGMIDFMTKPTSARELVAMVVRRADSRTQVLVIDDSLDIQMLVRRSLAADAICTVPAFDLEGARREVRRSRVSAAIVDMQLGGSTGADVIRVLRDEGAWGDLPFIALSGDAGQAAEPAMRALGCSHYLNKPARPSAIAESVRALLSGGSAQDAWHDELLGHEAADDDLSDLIPGYLASIKKELVLAQSALACNELDLIANAGHKMKGTGVSYGFISISKAGRALEDAAKAAQVGAVSTLLAELSQIVDEALSRHE